MVRAVMIACIHGSQESKEPTGFRLLDLETGKVADINAEVLQGALQSGKAEIDNLVYKKKFTGTNGSLDRYAKIVNGVVKSSDIVIVGKAPKGYLVSDFKGKLVIMDDKMLVKYGKALGLANGKIVTKNGKEYVSAIVGQYRDLEGMKILERFQKPESRKSNEEGKSKLKEKSKGSEKKAEALETQKSNTFEGSTEVKNKRRIRGIEVSLKDSQMQMHSLTGNTKLTVEQKLLRGIVALKHLKPFYYAVLQTIKRIESPEVKTMGVSLNKLYFSPKFVAELPIDQLIFVLSHEVLHLMMHHQQRLAGRDHKLYNIAADLYINRVIVEEFNLGVRKTASGWESRIQTESGNLEGDVIKEGIAIPRRALYNPKVDIYTDTPEKIYEELKENMKNMAQKIPRKGQKPQQDSEEDQEQGQGGQGQDQGGGSGEVEFRGEKYDLDAPEVVDIVTDDETAEMSEITKQAQYAGMMEKVRVLGKELEKSQGEDHGKGKGLLDVVVAIIDEALVPKVNWQQILSGKLQRMQLDERSLSTPDRRFVHRGLYIEGNRDDEEFIEGIKLCIDTSGSMTNEDIAEAFVHIKRLVRTYKVDSEIIFWDDGIQSTHSMTDDVSLEYAKHRATGRGGTDANCIFEYFESREFKNSKKSKPALVIIFTDGYIPAMDVEKYGKRYGKDTLWVIHGDFYDSFKPDFGRKARLKQKGW